MSGWAGPFVVLYCLAVLLGGKRNPTPFSTPKKAVPERERPFFCALQFARNFLRPLRRLLQFADRVRRIAAGARAASEPVLNEIPVDEGGLGIIRVWEVCVNNHIEEAIEEARICQRAGNLRRTIQDR